MNLSNWLTLLFLTAILILFWSLRDFIILVFAGIVIAVGICTITNKLKSKLFIPRYIAYILTLLSGILLISLLLIIIVPQFINEFEQLLEQLPSAANEFILMITSFINKFSIIIYGQESNIISKEGILSNTLSPLPNSAAIAGGITDSIKKIIDLAGNLGLGIVQIIFVISISLMISIQPKQYKNIIIILTPSFYRSRADFILEECGKSLSKWMIGVLISSIFVAVLAGITLYLLGVKLVIANAIIAGLLNIIPNIGPTISTIFPMSVALLDEPWKAVAVLGSYIVIQNIESYIITPSVMQQKTKLLPGLTLTAQFFFTIIFGPLGLLLALPLAVIMQVLTKEIIVKDILEKNKISTN